VGIEVDGGEGAKNLGGPLGGLRTYIAIWVQLDVEDDRRTRDAAESIVEDEVSIPACFGEACESRLVPN
jgi:hypothetical protein